MKRSQPIVVRLTDETKLVRIILESDPTEKGTLEDRQSKVALLQAIIDNPMLSNCLGTDFEKMAFYYDGTKWLADCSAVIKGKL